MVGIKEKEKEIRISNKEWSIEEWYSDNETISMYQERYGDEWLKKLNNTYEAMLSKLPCCEDCKEGTLIENNIYRVGSEKYLSIFKRRENF